MMCSQHLDSTSASCYELASLGLQSPIWLFALQNSGAHLLGDKSCYSMSQYVTGLMGSS